MNFAMMFAIALGIDYALFIVVRFRAALADGPRSPRGDGADDGDRGQGGARERPDGHRRAAGAHAGPGPGVPHGAARDRARRADGARGDADAAAGGALAPGPPHQRRPRALRRRRSTIAARASRPGAGACGRGRCPYGAAAVAILLVLAAPVLGLRTGMPTAGSAAASMRTRARAQQLLERAFGDGAASAAADRRGRPRRARHARRRSRATPASPRSRPPSARAATCCSPRPRRPRRASVRATIDRLRGALPAGALVGGPAAETRDLERALVSPPPARRRRGPRPRLPRCSSRCCARRSPPPPPSR